MAEAWRGGIGEYPPNPEGFRQYPLVPRRSRGTRWYCLNPEGWGGYSPMPLSHASAIDIVLWRKINTIFFIKKEYIDQCTTFLWSKSILLLSTWVYIDQCTTFLWSKFYFIKKEGTGQYPLFLWSKNDFTDFTIVQVGVPWRIPSHPEHYNLFFFLIQWDNGISMARRYWKIPSES